MKYTIQNSNPSIDKNTGQQYKDNYGNLSWSLMVQDTDGQQYSILKRSKPGNVPQVGDVLDGTITTEYSKTGNSYFKFTPTPKENTFQKSSSGDPASFVVSYAKDIVVALINNQDEKNKLTTENIKDDLDTLAFHMFGLLSSLKEGKTETKQESKVITANEEEVDINSIPF